MIGNDAGDVHRQLIGGHAVQKIIQTTTALA